MSDLFRVVYCSRNTIPGSPAAISAAVNNVLRTSRRNNAHQGITGALLFSQGIFAQVLEGPMGTVEQAFERIQCDHRHADVVVLEAAAIDERDFAEWTMAFTGSAGDRDLFGAAGLEGVLVNPTAGAEDILATLKSVIRHDAESAAA